MKYLEGAKCTSRRDRTRDNITGRDLDKESIRRRIEKRQLKCGLVNFINAL